MTQPGHPLLTALSALEPATTALLERRILLSRCDSKFVTSVDRVAEVVAAAAGDYAALPGATTPAADYRTLYYDTPGGRCYHDHRRGRRPRHKVRARHYRDRDLAFFEIKTRRSRRTTKLRSPTDVGQWRLDDSARAAVVERCDLPAEQLVPSAATAFRRATLLGLHTDERITVDLDVELCSWEPGTRSWSWPARDEGRRELLSGVAIVEVKQGRRDRETPFMRALRARGLRPTSMSKYCTAIALVRGDVPVNRLLPTLRALERLRQ